MARNEAEVPGDPRQRQWFFVRHGETVWNVAARIQGQHDSELTDLGRTQTHINGRLLASLGIEALFCSPLGRARASASIIGAYLGLPLVEAPRIKQWDGGDWTGYRLDEVKARWPAAWAAREADGFHSRAPNAENYPDMLARVAPFLECLRQRPERRVAIVSHGVIGRVMIAALLGFDAPAALGFRQPNDIVYRVTLTSGTGTIDHYAAGMGPAPGIVPRI